MNILAIDTSNQTLGVALMKDRAIIGKVVLNRKKNHSVQLMPAINQLMQENEMVPQDLNKIIVAHGPGSYTGVRIGLSTAKTMAWALNIPVIGVSSLELLAWNAAVFDGWISPFFDARRGLVFTGLYQWDRESGMKQAEQETNILLVDWLAELKKKNQPIVFLSPDVELHKKTIIEILGDLAVFPANSFHLPDSSLLFSAAEGKAALPVHQLTPNYLRLTEAESNWLKKQQGNG